MFPKTRGLIEATVRRWRPEEAEVVLRRVGYSLEPLPAESGAPPQVAEACATPGAAALGLFDHPRVEVLATPLPYVAPALSRPASAPPPPSSSVLSSAPASPMSPRVPSPLSSSERQSSSPAPGSPLGDAVPSSPTAPTPPSHRLVRRRATATSLHRQPERSRSNSIDGDFVIADDEGTPAPLTQVSEIPGGMEFPADAIGGAVYDPAAYTVAYMEPARGPKEVNLGGHVSPVKSDD